MTEPRLIRKYANRRLYDTVTSKHVNLDGVRELIADGIDVRVVDDTSGEDLTRSVLLQLVAEQERGGRPVLSDRMLMQIIRFYDHPMQGMLGVWLQQSFETFLAQQQEIQGRMREAMKGGPFAAFTEIAEKNVEAWQSMQRAFLKTRRNKDDDGKD